MATIYGGTIKSYWRVYLTYTLNNNYSNTHASISWSFGVNWVAQIKGNADDDGNYQTQYDRPAYVSCDGQTVNKYPTARLTKTWYNNGNRSYSYGSGTFYIAKTTYARTVTLKASSYHNSNSTRYKGTSTASVNLTISALPSYTISFNKNTQADVSGMPSNMTQYYGIGVTLPQAPTRTDGFVFQSWSGVNAGAKYTPNANTTLYAYWGAQDPPTCDISPITFSTSSDNIIRNFTDISCDISNIQVYHDRELDSVNGIRMRIAGKYSNAITSGTSGTLTILGQENGVPTFTKADEGLHTVYIFAEDNAVDGHAIREYQVGTVNIAAPTWEKNVEINASPPSLDQNDNAILDSLEFYNYTTSSWQTADKNGIKIVADESSWEFTYTFDEDHVSDALDVNPNIDVMVSYKHYDSDVPDGNRAFFTTSRNQNYSNGIYNVMFVGGVDNTNWAEYTSRVWWSKINDPLYFPDTNYIEVGSNDTAVQGLTKVGDYLAVVKQSKTTDTAIFLLYPTSFEEETTYAVKQGVQGVGALARYSFNILGDETLFLSPKGVVAVVPTQDEEHKVQNRSYFVDKRLLAEDAKNAYSFVHDGKYFLSIGNGHVYVLDGNQRNSWGNDKTVLVYECYYLENVPAKCFVKYQDALVFSDDTNVCIFNDGYVDDYDENGENVPVKAEWSTILDDDGALHYNKTMQKKGNLVSILPIENELPYEPVTVDEETFDADKELYFVFEDGKYVRCTESDEYSAETQYYIENRSNTKVFVKKDDKEPVEIERKFGLNSDIPSELFINKKFKKYKRLQFILRNEAGEDFGVDEIVKNYTVGNYAKK